MSIVSVEGENITELESEYFHKQNVFLVPPGLILQLFSLRDSAACSYLGEESGVDVLSSFSRARQVLLVAFHRNCGR